MGRCSCRQWELVVDVAQAMFQTSRTNDASIAFSFAAPEAGKGCRHAIVYSSRLRVASTSAIASEMAKATSLGVHQRSKTRSAGAPFKSDVHRFAFDWFSHNHEQRAETHLLKRLKL
jgi:hypothetical protein